MQSRAFTTDRHGDRVGVYSFPEHEGHVQLTVEHGGSAFRVALNRADALSLHRALGDLLDVGQPELKLEAA